jgi:hypothetical protein
MGPPIAPYAAQAAIPCPTALDIAQLALRVTIKISPAKLGANHALWDILQHLRETLHAVRVLEVSLLLKKRQ